MTAILKPEDNHLILINTFTVDPSNADALFEILAEATTHGMAARPGFVSANLHVSLDRKHVANYAQWRSQEDLDAMMEDPAAQAHMKKAAEIAESFQPIYYRLRESHAASK